jgi:Ca2+-binding EF-hand superfamily protein
MLLALAAASSAVDALQSLISSKSTSTQTTGFSQNPPTPFDTTNGSTQTESPLPVTGGAGFTQISPATMSALIAAQGQDSSASTTSATTTSAPTDPASALNDLFSQIDANGDGKISQSEFENALGAGGTNIAQADDVFNKLDANGDGSVSLEEMQKALQGTGGHHHHHHVADSGDSTSADGTSSTTGTSGSGGAGSNSDPLLQALAGATSTSVTNSDGSTTTSITNADGSVITMTSPAATTSSSSATASYNFLEQMIQRAAQAVSSGAASSLSLNV